MDASVVAAAPPVSGDAAVALREPRVPAIATTAATVYCRLPAACVLQAAAEGLTVRCKPYGRWGEPTRMDVLQLLLG